VPSRGPLRNCGILGRFLLARNRVWFDDASDVGNVDCFKRELFSSFET
jgi:hypothetical protein